MELIGVTYSGRKPYKDKTPLRTSWMPGDTKRVPEDAARVLCRFAEFARAQDQGAQASDDEVMAAVVSVKQKDKDEEAARNNMLNLIDSMDKDALEAYARNYEVELDKRRRVSNLRAEVVSLVEQFGVR
jgi:hypothetical protein